jgi:hypothetical protein
MVGQSWGMPRARHIYQLVDDIMRMRDHARDKGYADNSLTLLISEQAFHEIRRINDPTLYDGRQILKMDYYIIEEEMRESQHLFADLLIKTRLAHYQDIPPRSADEVMREPRYEPKKLRKMAIPSWEL